MTQKLWSFPTIHRLKVMADDSEAPELPQQVQALLCFLVHVDYVTIKTGF